jgi:hypothetical protein
LLHILAALASLLFALPATAGDVDRLRLPGLQDVQRTISPPTNPNALPNALPPSRTGPASPDDALSGTSLSPKFDPPGLEFKKAF